MLRPNPLGDWPALVERLDRAGCPQRWSAHPDLRELTCVQQLREWTEAGDRRRCDAVMGALVRLAAADEDAVVVLLHLLCPGAKRLAGRLGHLSPDPLSLVLGELAIRIRCFPVERRTRAYAANLLMDTQMVVWRELRPYRTDLRHRPADILVDPLDDARAAAAENGQPGLLDGIRFGPEADELDLLDLLLWARRTGAVDAEDLAVLVELEYAREIPGASPQRRVAEAHGWTVRTVQRRRDRALAGLRACSADYLGAA
jgi:hypothetical protein